MPSCYQQVESRSHFWVLAMNKDKVGREGGKTCWRGTRATIGEDIRVVSCRVVSCQCMCTKRAGNIKEGRESSHVQMHGYFLFKLVFYYACNKRRSTRKRTESLLAQKGADQNNRLLRLYIKPFNDEQEREGQVHADGHHAQSHVRNFLINSLLVVEGSLLAIFLFTLHIV